MEMEVYIAILIILILLSIKWCSCNLFQKDEKIKLNDVLLVLLMSICFFWILSLMEITNFIKYITGRKSKTSNNSNDSPLK